MSLTILIFIIYVLFNYICRIDDEFMHMDLAAFGKLHQFLILGYF